VCLQRLSCACNSFFKNGRTHVPGGEARGRRCGGVRGVREAGGMLAMPLTRDSAWVRWLIPCASRRQRGPRLAGCALGRLSRQNSRVAWRESARGLAVVGVSA